MKAKSYICALCLLTLGVVPGVTAAPPLSQAETAEYDTPAKPIKLTHPKYPKAAYKKKIQGTVVVEFAIDAEGKPHDLKVVESVPGLDEAALAAVKEWTFSPARKNGVPVPTQKAKAPVVFKIY
jgi:protein TonB